MSIEPTLRGRQVKRVCTECGVKFMVTMSSSKWSHKCDKHVPTKIRWRRQDYIKKREMR